MLFMSISSDSLVVGAIDTEDLAFSKGDIPSGSDDFVIDQLLEHFVAEVRAESPDHWIVWPSETGG